MKLEFLDDISDGGKFKDVVSNQLVRLYDFDKLQANKFRQLIQSILIDRNQTLDLSTAEFVEPVNCTLTLCLADTDIGITTGDKINFICALTMSGYENMISLLEPFCIEDNSGHQWLYDIDTPIDFLFSPSGTW